VQTRAAMPLQQFGKVQLVNRSFASLQTRQLGYVIVNTDDVVADLSKASGGDKTNISRSDNSYFHAQPSPKSNEIAEVLCQLDSGGAKTWFGKLYEQFQNRCERLPARDLERLSAGRRRKVCNILHTSDPFGTNATLPMS
jgi:hypothetical protein